MKKKSVAVKLELSVAEDKIALKKRATNVQKIRQNEVCLRGYLHETGMNSDRHEFVSTSIHFFLCVYMRPA